jgi:hypothetical protein
MNYTNRTTLTVALLVGLLLLLSAFVGLSGVGLESGAVSINWSVIGGGGTQVHSTPYSLDSTIGQAVVGTTADTALELCSGFWCGAQVGYRVYLPLMPHND